MAKQKKKERRSLKDKVLPMQYEAMLRSCAEGKLSQTAERKFEAFILGFERHHRKRRWAAKILERLGLLKNWERALKALPQFKPTKVNSIIIHLPEEVTPAPRPRPSSRGGAWDPGYKEKRRIREKLKELLPDDWIPKSSDCGFSLVVHYAIPRSKKIADKIMMATGEIPKTSIPDLDNVEKTLMDAANTVLWDDDAQVTDKDSCKRYAAFPKVELLFVWREE
jgi:Holliday junction resolvase RusA-like endonuclease